MFHPVLQNIKSDPVLTVSNNPDNIDQITSVILMARKLSGLSSQFLHIFLIHVHKVLAVRNINISMGQMSRGHLSTFLIRKSKIWTISYFLFQDFRIDIFA